MRKNEHSCDHYFSVQPKSEMKLGMVTTYLRRRRFKFMTASGVFSRKRVDLGTRLLIESMILPERGHALDVGCGYGAVGITAAVFNPNLHVLMVDLNERAVWLAKRNIEVNNVNNAEVRQSHLYEAVRNLKFNCVLSNPPVSAGMDKVKSIIDEAPEHMVDKASFQMVVRSKIAGRRLVALLESAFGNAEILSRRSGYRVLISEKR